jgi:predicted aminopeptidase
MLTKSPGQLARVIIHELTHGTLYVKNDIQFNENLASFVGDKGAILFLNWKYGETSAEVKDYLGDFSDMAKVRNHLLRGTEVLKTFYAQTDSIQIIKEKQNEIERIINNLDTISLYNKGKLDNIIANSKLINNTFFTDFLTYRKEQNSLEEEFNKDFNSNFESYLTHLKNKYPSL